MKYIIALLVAITILSWGRANADLVYISDFRMISDRSTLVVLFGDDIDVDGTISFEVTFGQALKAKTMRLRIPHISDRQAFMEAMNTFLRILNDDDTQYLSILHMLDYAGWPLERR